MTYCLAIKVNSGLVFASDSRTNAGVDYVSTFSKMHVFHWAEDRLFVLLTAGNLATSQAVVNEINRDLEEGNKTSLRSIEYLFDAADYVGRLSVRIQKHHEEGISQSNIRNDASFIVGGQIAGKDPEIYLVYPQGNYIKASPETPFLQIGENKYGKPILDRIITPHTSLAEAARCALVSLDSTMRSNVSVGPPLELLVYEACSLTNGHHMTLELESPLYKNLQKHWNEGIHRAFEKLPRFDWETQT
ncbi:MAG: proteasome-type protease [Gammaproteobacteria bacterium]|jgi:putative proteasome-type protease